MRFLLAFGYFGLAIFWRFVLAILALQYFGVLFWRFWLCSKILAFCFGDIDFAIFWRFVLAILTLQYFWRFHFGNLFWQSFVSPRSLSASRLGKTSSPLLKLADFSLSIHEVCDSGPLKKHPFSEDRNLHVGPYTHFA